MSRENVEIARRAFRAANRRPKPDFATVNALFGPDHILVSAISGVEGRSYRGADGFREWRTDMDEAWESRQVTVEQVAGIDDERVLVTWVFRARSKRGVPFEQRMASVLTVRDRKITRTENYRSVAEALEVVGRRE